MKYSDLSKGLQEVLHGLNRMIAAGDIEKVKKVEALLGMPLPLGIWDEIRENAGKEKNK